MKSVDITLTEIFIRIVFLSIPISRFPLRVVLNTRQTKTIPTLFYVLKGKIEIPFVYTEMKD